MKFRMTVILESPRHADESAPKEALEYFGSQAWREGIEPIINGNSKDEKAWLQSCELLER